MKKLMALLLAAVMVLSMAACQAHDEKTDKPTETTQTTGETQKPADTTEGTEAPGTTEPTTEATEPTTEATEPTTEPPETTEPTTEPTEPFVPEIGEGVYSKTSYTATDEELLSNGDKVIATAGDAELTISELQVYYWMNVISFLNQYSYELEYLGLDFTKPMDQQAAPDGKGTWQQFFLQEALASWHEYQAMELEAIEQKTPISEELQKELDGLDENMEAAAKEEGHETVDAMLQADLGPGITMESYRSYLTTYVTGYGYYEYNRDAVKITDKMIDQYYTEHEKELVEGGAGKDAGKLVDVRHILLTPQGGTTDESGATTYSDAEWKACEEEAQAVLDLWLAGDKSEESFAALATEHTTDPGSQATGGLYEGVATGDMVPEFDAWCFDENRKVGDHGLVKTTYGYHVMYYSGDEAIWINQCREAILAQEVSKFIEAACEKHPMDVQYENLMLGNTSFGA